MIRPVLGLPLDQARQLLREHMERSEYPWLESHLPIIDASVVFVCMDGEYIAGYVWFYMLEEDAKTWVVHMSLEQKYRKAAFSRTTANTIFAVCYSLGCDAILAESESRALLRRIGAVETEDGALLRLPYVWR